jgi:2,3-diaminopropionate biosynthesis protein SbnB
MDSILWLKNEQVASLLTPTAALANVERALKLHTLGLYQQPLKPYIRPGGREHEYRQGRVIVMPAYLGGEFNVIGCKIIAGFPANVDKGLPRASGLMVLNSATTGFPLAIMECAELSARRTAAVASLCLRDLAGPGPHDVAIFGAGPIAGAVIDALAERANVRRFHLYDPRLDRAQALAATKNSRLTLATAVATEMTSALTAASVVVLATTGARGYLTHELTGRKKLIVALSLDDATEDLFLSADKIVVDSFDDCNREEKLMHRLVQRGLFSREQVHAELGEILLGRKAGRQRPDEFIYVNPMGMAIEDAAVAWWVYQAALERKIGTILQ